MHIISSYRHFMFEHLSPLQLCCMFRNFLVNGSIFEEENVFFMKRVFNFLKALPETSLHPKITRQTLP
jgi:hypothetical protein